MKILKEISNKDNVYYRVFPYNKGPKDFDSPEEAIKYLGTQMFLVKVDQKLKDLKSGKEVAFVYGFTTGVIIPQYK